MNCSGVSIKSWGLCAELKIKIKVSSLSFLKDFGCPEAKIGFCADPEIDTGGNGGKGNSDWPGYRLCGGKFLRRGYTTGTCAAAAARAAVLAMVGGGPAAVPVKLPGGHSVEVPVEGFKRRGETGVAWVIKDAGDDPDVTHGARIEATVKFLPAGKGIIVRGGEGVGTVTKPGLAIPPQQPAINPVPLKMIRENVSEVLPEGEGAEVTISVPEGKRLARHTLNSQLGIVDGISILGTTGIVEPMSEEAFKLALLPQLQISRATGYLTVLLTPGRRGVKLATQNFGVPPEAVVVMSNFVGFILEECVKHGILRVILWGYAGKLAKVAAGVFQTHSRIGDGRREVVAALSAARGASQELIREILDAPTVERMAELLADAGLAEVWHDIAKRASLNARLYTKGLLQVGTAVFSSGGETMGWDKNALRFIEEAGWKAGLRRLLAKS